MIRSNDYIEKIVLSLRKLLKDFPDVFITTENTDMDERMKKYKCIILLNHIPMNEFNRAIDGNIESVILNTGCYIFGNLKYKKYMIDIIDKITQELYEGCEFDIETDTEYITYLNYFYNYESSPDTHNVIYFSGTIRIEIDFKEV